MFHLDNNSGISSMPKPAAQQSAAPRWFTEGSGNDSPSWPGQDWFNIVQAELLNVLSEAGIAPVKTTHTQLAQAIKDIIAANSNVKNALLKNNNLSDLENKTTARKNLELGTAAVKDVQTSRDDTTGGRVLINGSAIALRTATAKLSGGFTDNTDSLPGNSVSFVYGEAVNSPGITGSLIDFSGVGGGYSVQICASYNPGSSLKFRSRNGDANKWNTWHEIYHTGHKPSAADVGALSTSGGTVNGTLTVNSNIQIGTRGNAAIHIGDDDSGLRNSLDGQVDLWANNAQVGYWKNTEFSYNGSFISKAANGLRLVQGDYGFIIRNDGGSTYFMLTNAKDPMGGYNTLRPLYINNSTGDVTLGKVNFANWTNIDNRYYTKTLADQRFQPKGNFTPAGQAYTKSESDARYVQNVQLGAQSALSGNSQAPTGCVFTYVYLGERVAYKPIQIYINGAWRTVSG